MKRALITEEQQLELDQALLSKCAGEGSLSQLAVLIEQGANPNTPNAKGATALMWLCKRKGNMSIAAKLLIAAGADVKAVDNENNRMAIHVAAAASDLLTVWALIDAGSPIEPIDSHGQTPLFLAILRKDGEGLEIASMLLGRGAKINHRVVGGLTVLSIAIQNGMEELVAWLLQHGANAASVDDAGKSCLEYACEQDGRMVRLVGSHLDARRQLSTKSPNAQHGDPIGILQEGARFGMQASAAKCIQSIKEAASGAYIWALMRSLGPRPGYALIWAELSKSRDPQLWHWIALDYLNTRDESNRDTLMHWAARENNVVALRELMALWANPLLRNDQKLLPINLATDTEASTILRSYTQQRPCLQVMRWYGPYLLARVRTMLLVFQRCQFRPPKDIRWMLINCVRALEYI
jgi:ankyrin repeat protein